MNDVEYALSCVEIVHGYRDYVPEEVLMGEPEVERFDSAVAKLERAIEMIDPDDLAAYHQQREAE